MILVMMTPIELQTPHHGPRFVGQRLGVHEPLDAHELTPAALEQMTAARELIDGKTLAALLVWERASAQGSAV